MDEGNPDTTTASTVLQLLNDWDLHTPKAATIQQQAHSTLFPQTPFPSIQTDSSIYAASLEEKANEQISGSSSENHEGQREGGIPSSNNHSSIASSASLLDATEADTEFFWTDFSFLSAENIDATGSITASGCGIQLPPLFPNTPFQAHLYQNPSLSPGSSNHLGPHDGCRLTDLSLTLQQQQPSTGHDGSSNNSDDNDNGYLPSLLSTLDDPIDHSLYRHYNTTDDPVMPSIHAAPSLIPHHHSQCGDGLALPPPIARLMMTTPNSSSKSSSRSSIVFSLPTAVTSPSSALSTRSSSRMSSFSSVGSALSLDEHRHGDLCFHELNDVVATTPSPNNSHNDGVSDTPPLLRARPDVYHHVDPSHNYHPSPLQSSEISVSDFLETFDLPHSYLDFTSDDVLDNPQPPTITSTTTSTSTTAVNHNNNSISESLLGISDLLAYPQLQQVVNEGLGLTRSLAAPTFSSQLPTNLLDGTDVGSSIFNWQPSVESHAFGSITGNSSNGLSTMTVDAVTTGVPVTGWSSGYALQAWLQTSTPQQVFLPDYSLPVMQTMQALLPQAQSTMRLLDSDSSPFLQWSQQPPMQKLSAPQFSISSQGPNLGYPSLHHRLAPQQSCEYDFYPFQTPNHTLDFHPQQLHQCSVYPFPTGEHKHGLRFSDMGLELYPGRTRYLATSPPAISVLKRRRRLTNEESEFLLHRFGLNERPTAQERESFAKHLNLDRRTIQVWFQNRRAKLKRDVRGGDDDADASAGGSGGSSGSGEEDASETVLMLMLQQQEDMYGAEGKDGESGKVDFEIETETESAKGATAVDGMACIGWEFLPLDLHSHGL